MTLVPLARLLGGRPPEHLHSSHDPILCLRCERTHLDGTVRGSRTSCRPFEGCIERRQFQNGESSQLFFRVSIWAVLHTPLALLNFYRGSGFRHLQRVTCDEDACLDQSLMIGAPGARVCVGPVAFPRCESLWRFVDQQCELHHFSPSRRQFYMYLNL